ncbi:MAG: hypothetical protein ACNYPD_06610 [Candidatus Halichondribacter symbioticus]
MPSQREGYAQKTMLVGIRVAMTKTQRAESVIANLGQSTILGNDRPKKGGRAHPHHCFLILAGVPAGGARQLIGCTGSIVFKSRW